MRLSTVARAFLFLAIVCFIVTIFIPSQLLLKSPPAASSPHPFLDGDGRKPGGVHRHGNNKNKLDQARYCLEHRGDSGKWVLDWDYAAHHQYKTFGNFPKTMIANQLFQSTPDQPYRKATAYRWKDDDCPVRTITRQGFCEVLRRLQITRVYTAGDSLMEAFTSSLRGLLGYPKWGSIQFIKRRWSQPCGGGGSGMDVSPPWFINHTYRRVETPNTDFQQFFDTYDLQETRRDFLLDNPNRTVLVLNIGAHVHTMTNFTQSFQSLLHVVDSTLSSFPSRPNTLVFFRNTPPGHADCRPRKPPKLTNWSALFGDGPYRNYAEYQAATGFTTQRFDWHLFESYNLHARTRILERRRRQQQEEQTQQQSSSFSSSSVPASMFYLNVFNATVLRPDGHVGLEDCLHYNLPGPTDWWVHFWYSALWDLAILLEANADPSLIP